MPSYSRLPSYQGALSFCILVGALSYAAVVSGACGCYLCLSGGTCALRTDDSGDAFDNVTGSLTEEDGEEVPFAEFRINNRWTSTAYNSSTGSRGAPITLTWGIVADGTPIPGDGGASSSLISMLNAQYGAGPGGVENAPWFRLFEESFGRWSELSGVTYLYEPNDGGAAIDGTSAPRGQRGVYADVRIGGHPIDGASGSNTLAYNYFPTHSDMVIDTDNFSFYGNSQFDSRRLRNVLMHEAGHGLGFNHLESDNSGQLMEPFITTAFDGPQIDDILAAHRNYGDVLEKGAGNDSPRNPMPIGDFGSDDRWALGVDGSASVVSPSQTDFVSIDGFSDVDYYGFTVTEPVKVNLSLLQVGRSYNEGPQGGDQSVLDTSRLNPLELTLYSNSATEGIAVLAEGTPRRDTQKVITDVTLMPGTDYMMRIRGTVDNVQLYRLNLGFFAIPVPEPGTVALAALAAMAGVGRRRAA